MTRGTDSLVEYFCSMPNALTLIPALPKPYVHLHGNTPEPIGGNQKFKFILGCLGSLAPS